MKKKYKDEDSFYEKMSDILFRVQNRVKQREWNEISVVFDVLDEENRFYSLRNTLLEMSELWLSFEIKLSRSERLNETLRKVNEQMK